MTTLTGHTKMKGQIVGYARVSSADQNLVRQLEQLKSENTDKILKKRQVVPTPTDRHFNNDGICP